MNDNHNLYYFNWHSFLLNAYTFSVYLAVIGIIYFITKIPIEFVFGKNELSYGLAIVAAIVLVKSFYRFEPKKKYRRS